MGICTNLCSKKDATAYNPVTDSGDIQTYTIMSTIKDPLQRFQKEFPFQKLHIQKFVELAKNSGKDRLDFAYLKGVLDTPAW
jgi:hypothetical protein